LRVWRLVKPEFYPALDGKGAAIIGGRWNEAGVPAVYTAGSVALAALEVFVHLNRDLRLAQNLPTLILIGMDIPGDLIETAPVLATDAPSARTFGTRWLRSGRSLGLLVQSHVVPHDQNLILNPAHPAMAPLLPQVSETFTFDPRMAL
jgi:RES domain-containing protein